jgi:hypothetical protein
MTQSGQVVLPADPLQLQEVLNPSEIAVALSCLV